MLVSLGLDQSALAKPDPQRNYIGSFPREVSYWLSNKEASVVKGGLQWALREILSLTYIVIRNNLCITKLDS